MGLVVIGSGLELGSGLSEWRMFEIAAHRIGGIESVLMLRRD